MIELENLLSNWHSMSEVEKASTISISHLVRSGEEIISDERVAWISTANKNAKEGALARAEEGGVDERAQSSSTGKKESQKGLKRVPSSISPA